jgi:hypothetical protein
MKIYNLTLLIIVISIVSCNEEVSKTDVSIKVFDTIPPVITLNGNENDTACLGLFYMDQGASINDGDRCVEICLKVTGTVNNTLTGDYVLDYDASDDAGNHAATVTRTVHVMENSAGFLNGIYNVACSCTAAVSGMPNPTITADSYIASVSSGAFNRSFVLSALRIGPEKITPSTALSGNSINVYYFGREYHPASNASGTLSASNNTFTIESTFYQWHPTIIYKCKNIYTNSNVEEAVNKTLADRSVIKIKRE